MNKFHIHLTVTLNENNLISVDDAVQYMGKIVNETLTPVEELAQKLSFACKETILKENYYLMSQDAYSIAEGAFKQLADSDFFECQKS